MTKSARWVSVISTALAAWIAHSIPCAAQEGKPARVIPLDSIYTTSPQKDLKRVKATAVMLGGKKFFKEPHGLALTRTIERLKDGASDVFLGEVVDLADVIVQTGARLCEGGLGFFPMDPLKKPGPAKGRQNWLVAYLGKGPAEEAAWSIVSVEVGPDKMRVSYRREKAAGFSTLPYLYWVPLGDVALGNLWLELFDVDEKATMLTRRYRMGGPDKGDAPPLAGKARQVPLTEIFGTSGQADIKRLDAVGAVAELTKNDRNHLRVMLSRSRSIESAIRASADVRFSGRPADEAVNLDPDSPRRDYWLSTQFPWGGSGPRYIVKSVTIADKTIRWSYQVAESKLSSPVVHHHLFWAPLGELEPGSYSVELHDMDRNQIDLARRIRVR